VKAALLNAAFVGAGGFVGAICRYGLSGLVQQNLRFATFPYGTMAVNLAGCFLIGLSMGAIETRQLFAPELRLFLLVGVLGGFTTYSTFGYETFALLRDAEFLQAMLNVSVHVVFGLLLVWGGYLLTAR